MQGSDTTGKHRATRDVKYKGFNGHAAHHNMPDKNRANSSQTARCSRTYLAFFKVFLGLLLPLIRHPDEREDEKVG